MLRFDDLQLFVRAADLGSLSAAARVMDMSSAVASAALKRIEQQLGARLLARSTRSLRLTAEGEGFLEYARAALSNLDEGRRLLASGQDQVSGVLQLSAPSDFGRNLLLPWLDEFQREHPKLTVRLLLGDRIADLFRQPVDIALRYGEPEDSSLIALPIAPHNRRVLCASPAYLAQHGEPRQLEQLAQHNCLLFMLGSRVHDLGASLTAGAKSALLSRGTASVTTPTWYVCGPWQVPGLPINPGWTWAPMFSPGASKCCCRSCCVSALR